MAISISTLNKERITSIHGNRLGLDRRDLLLTQGVRIPCDDATSDTTGTAIKGYGWTNVDTSTNDSWLLEPPVPGAFKYLYMGSTSTGIRTIVREDNSFAIRTTANSTGVAIVAQGGGQTIVLYGVSTAIYAVVSKPASTELAISGSS